MPTRKPSGFALEEHRKFVQVFKMIIVLSNRYPVSHKIGRIQGRMHSLLINLRSEMDEYVYIDCPEIPVKERLGIYYGWKDYPQKIDCDIRYIRSTLDELIAGLSKTNANGKGIKYTSKLIAYLDKLAAIESGQAS